MKTFYLVRHPKVENPKKIVYGRLPFPLSRAGETQAHKIAAWLADKEVSKIYSSKVFRCFQTAEIIAAKIKASVIYDQRLLETLNVAQGMTPEMYKEYNVSDYSLVNDWGGETIKDVMTRVANFVDEIKKKEKGNLVICSHGDPLSLIFAHMMGRKIKVPADIYKSGHYQEKGSVRAVEIDGNKASLKQTIQF